MQTIIVNLIGKFLSLKICQTMWAINERVLLSDGFTCVKEKFAKIDWNVFAAKDIQSRCRNLREMKDVFKELKVLGRKGKSCTAQN